MKHTFETDSSIWTLDDHTMMATRLPKGGETQVAPNGPVPYTKLGAPAEFVYAHVVKAGGKRLCVHYVNHPTGKDYHYWAQTGVMDGINPLFSLGQDEGGYHDPAYHRGD